MWICKYCSPAVLPALAIIIVGLHRRASQAAKKAEIALPHLADPIVSIKHVHEPSVGDYEITICHPWMCVDESIDDQEGYSVLAHGEKNKMMRKGKTPTTRTTTATATTFQDAHPGVTTSAAERRQNEHKRRYDAKIRQQKNQNQRALQDKMTGIYSMSFCVFGGEAVSHMYRRRSSKEFKGWTGGRGK